MDSDTPPLYVVHHPAGARTELDCGEVALRLAMLLHERAGRAIRVDVLSPPAAPQRRAPSLIRERPDAR